MRRGKLTGLAVASTLLVAIGMLGCTEKTPGPAGKGTGSKESATKGSAAKAPKPKPPKQKLDVAVRIADADMEVVIQPAKLVAGKVLGDFAAELKKAKLPIPVDLGAKTPEQMAAESIGIEMKDLARVTISANTITQKVLATLVATKDVDAQAVVAALSASTKEKVVKRETHAGIDIYAPAQEQEAMLAFVDKRVALFGSIDELKKGIDTYKAGSMPPAKPEIAALLKEAAADACIVVAMKASPEMTAAAPAAGVPADLAQELDSVLFTMAAKDTFALQAKVTMKTIDSGEKLRGEATNAMEGAKAQFGPMFASPAMKPVMDAINGVKVGGAGKVLEASASIGADVVQPLAALASMFMGAGMAPPGGAMPPGGGMMPPGAGN